MPADSELIVEPPIDWAGIRAAAVTVGVRRAARQAARDLPPDEQKRFVDRVMQRSHREGWIRQKTAIIEKRLDVAQAKPMSAPVSTGADSIAAALAEDSDATKIGFSTTARKFAEHVATKKPNLDKDRAQAIRHMAGVASTVHGWEAKDGGDRRVMINIGILAE
jgi:hypothetical protein